MSPQHIRSPMPCPHAQLSSHRGGWQRGLEPSLLHTPLLGLRHVLSRGSAAELRWYVTLSPGRGLRGREMKMTPGAHSGLGGLPAGGRERCVSAPTSKAAPEPFDGLEPFFTEETAARTSLKSPCGLRGLLLLPGWSGFAARTESVSASALTRRTVRRRGQRGQGLVR